MLKKKDTIHTNPGRLRIWGSDTKYPPQRPDQQDSLGNRRASLFPKTLRPVVVNNCPKPNNPVNPRGHHRKPVTALCDGYGLFSLCIGDTPMCTNTEGLTKLGWRRSKISFTGRGGGNRAAAAPGNGINAILNKSPVWLLRRSGTPQTCRKMNFNWVRCQ